MIDKAVLLNWILNCFGIVLNFVCVCVCVQMQVHRIILKIRISCFHLLIFYSYQNKIYNSEKVLE